MALLIVLLPVTGYLGWYNYQRIKGGGDADEGLPIPFVQHQASPNITWHFPVEECWLVDETARDIAELLGFARNPAGKLAFSAEPAGEGPRQYQLSATLDGSQVKQTFATKEYIWSPADYSAWARELLAGWKLQPAAKPEPAAAELLARLTDAAPQTLIQESKRVSEALSQNPLDASLHEQAALITMAFAMREAAGEFNDTRRELCRAAAHLAIARALKPTADGIIRPIAEVALQTLAGREAAAMESLKAPMDAPGAASWVRALRLRNTGDWRMEIDAAVPLEMVEEFRARAHSVNSHFAILWAQKQKPSPLHDLRRLVLANGFGVEDGHGFAKESVPQEIVALSTDWKTFFGRELPQSETVKAFSEPAARPIRQGGGQPPKIEVLGWDLWSAQHQRHFCASLEATNHFLRDLWGVPEYRQLQQFAKLNFPSLPLFPLIERELSEGPRDAGGITTRVSALIKEHPEQVSPALWQDCLKPCKSGVPTLGVVAPYIWFQPLVPSGTTYGFDQRCWGFPLPAGADPFWTNLIAIAPSEYLLRYGKVWKAYGDRPPAGFAEEVYAPILAYNLRAMEHLADTQRDRSTAYPQTMQRICELDPDQYFDLGKWYLDHKDETNAAEAYRKGVDLGEDRIRASNSCGWLVNYLDNHGQAEKAISIATEAADVYSYRGLETLARLKEKHGLFKEAEDLYQKIAERYENDGNGPLTAFYLRNQEKDPAFKKAAAGMSAQLFPNGMTKATLTDFNEPPTEGTQLTSNSDIAAAVGLRSGDVIVALDGYRVRSEGQYLFVRGLSEAPELHLIVWNGRSYRELTASPPERRFSVNLKDYKGAGR